MIHQQEHYPARFYAYCACGVCGPLRSRREHAEADERAHAEVCRAKEEARNAA